MPDHSSTETPSVSRDKWVQTLHRRPTRWDVLLHQLADSMVRRHWHAQKHFGQAILRLDADELTDCAMQMARAFGLEMSTAGVSHLTGAPRPSLFSAKTNSEMDAVIAAGESAINEALINYLEIAHGCFLKRNHPDLKLLLPRIHEALRRFIIDKCGPEGELYPCIDNPLGDDEGYFPAAQRPADPAESCGNAALDAYRLNVLVHDADGPAEVMRKLVDFVKSDPAIAPEYTVAIVLPLTRRLLEAQRQSRPFNADAEAVHLRNRFIFSPCRQGGLSPAEIFRRRHLLASPRQQEHLARWATQSVDGVFEVIERTAESLTLLDIASQREIAVKPDPVLTQLPAAKLVRVRLVPWEAQWLVCGAIQVIDDRPGLRESMASMLHPMNARRQADEDDPRIAYARDLVGVIHEHFVARFGQDVALFPTMDTCRAALADFHQQLLTQIRLPDGSLLADAWRMGVGLEFPAFDPDRLGRDDELISSPGVLYDARHGMAFLPQAGELMAAMTAETVNDASKKVFELMMLAKWRPGWIIERLAGEYPQRVRQLLAEMLGDATFDMERQLPGLLGRMKCPDHTLPQRPAAFV